MRFLADENFPLPSVDLLRAPGHDVVVAAQLAPGAPDTTIADRARLADRTLLTFDRDFGELVFRFDYPAPPGIVYLRMSTEPPDLPGRHVLELIADPLASIRTRFNILELARVRYRTLPGF